MWFCCVKKLRECWYDHNSPYCQSSTKCLECQEKEKQLLAQKMPEKVDNRLNKNLPETEKICPICYGELVAVLTHVDCFKCNHCAQIFNSDQLILNYGRVLSCGKQDIKKDSVNHPSHYQSGKIEAIDVIEAFALNFNRGNALKYILRAGKKGSIKEDLSKAIWYLKREVEGLE